MKQIIGIGGELESGKSTVANIFVSKYGYVEKSFAKNLKDMCRTVFDLSDYQVNHTDGKKELLPSPILFSQQHIDEIILWATVRNGFEVMPEMIEKMQKYIGKEFITSRMILQFIGTEICRECIDDSYHITVVGREIADEELVNVIISDARFANERAWIESEGGFTVLVYNPHAPKPTGAVHLSEQVGNPDHYDFTLINDKTLGLKVLEKNVDLIAHMIFGIK